MLGAHKKNPLFFEKEWVLVLQLTEKKSAMFKGNLKSSQCQFITLPRKLLLVWI